MAANGGKQQCLQRGGCIIVVVKGGVEGEVASSFSYSLSSHEGNNVGKRGGLGSMTKIALGEAELSLSSL
jgi:hypothetical protein